MLVLNRKTTFQGLLVLATLAIIGLTGLVHGIWTHRWRTSRELEIASARVKELQLVLPGWNGKARAIQEESLKQAEITGYTRQLFTDEKDGQKVSFLLMCGRPGPLSVHTPQYCYGGAGYEMLGDPSPYQLRLPNGRMAQFLTARFFKPRSPGSPPLRIFWSWNDGKGWKTPGAPRWTFRRAEALHKLYVIREMAHVREPLSQEKAVSFLREILPVLQEKLFQAPKASEKTSGQM